MSTAARPGTSPLDQHDAALAALRDLCRPLKGGAAVEPLCVVVQPNEIPHPSDSLLVHHEHMTEVLQRHCGRAVDLHVLDYRLEGNFYTRKVKLTPAGSDEVVEWGIARLDLRVMPDLVREEILARQAPLGDILVRHNVHRRIKPRWFMRFPGGGPLLSFFGDRGGEPVYGRIGTIYCDDSPAIELLEIVTSAPV